MAVNCIARVPDIDSRIYRPLDNIKDLKFKINANHIIDLISSKASTQKIKNLEITSYRYDGTKGISVKGIENVSQPIRNKVEELFLSKSNIVWGVDLKQWLSAHKFVKEENGWFTFVDDSGMLDAMKIKIKFQHKKLQIVEKRPTGTLKATYKFQSKKWSKNLLVLNSVKREIYEGIQSIIIENKIEYKEHGKLGWLPSRVTAKTVQRVVSGSTKKVQRMMEEEFIFFDYKVNQSFAKNWFSQRN